MNKHVDNFIQGVASLWPATPRGYSTNGGGFKRDAKVMKTDFRNIGNDMRKALKNEQTQTHKLKVR